jgi:hypothetical protein
MDLKELLKNKQQKQQFNQQSKQTKVPVFAQKPMKKVTGRGR